MSRKRTYNLSDLFQIVVETKPDDEALVCGDKRLTYRQIEERSTQLALWLRAKGIVAGDTVGIHAFNCSEYVEICMAAFKLKAIPVNINFRYTVEELRYLYDNADLKALIYSAALEPLAEGAMSSAPGLRAIASIGGAKPTIKGTVNYEDALASASGSLDDIVLSDDDLMLLYTGGTTGMPKGVIWPHKAIFYAGFGGGGNFHPDGPIKAPEELVSRVKEGFYMKLLPTAPLMHGAGLWATLIGLYAGHTVFINENPGFDPVHILDKIVKEEISCMMIVGDAMGIPMLETLKANPGRWDLSSLMAISSAGALFSEHVQNALKEFLPPYTRIINSMGSSETGQAGTGAKPATEGLISLARNETTDVAVDGVRFAKPGEMGILVRMGYLPLGYFKDPKKTAETFVTVDGQRWAIPGDYATVEADGMVTVLGRGSVCINSGGEKIFPEEVESVLKSHPAVFDALVVGVPDERWGNRVAAVVQFRPGQQASLEELAAHCRTHIAGYKVPRELHPVQQVRRSPSGKPDYPWAQHLARETQG